MRVAVVEDIITTGGSVRLVLDMIEAVGGGGHVAVGCLIDRSGGASFPVPFHALAATRASGVRPGRVPALRAKACRSTKPGSRGIGG